MTLFKTYLLTALATIFWGANFNLAKPVVAEMHPYVAGASRFLIAAVIMLAITLYRGENVPLRYIRTYVILGLMGVFGFNLFFFLGMQSTSAANGALIMALNPLITTLLAYVFLQQQPSKRQLLGFPIGVLGVGIVVLGAGAHLHIASGDWLIFAANISWAFYNVFARKLMPKDISSIAATTGIMIVGALALTAVALASGEKFIIPSPHAGSALLLMTIGGSVLAYLLWNAGIAKLGASQAAIFLNLVPVSSMIIATFEGIHPNQAQLIGGALVISAVTFASWPMRPKMADR
ncbi:S-adenosylmethionine/S-adenosylhomocysteine transporter [mine drainage metagenome]|uniref:S-adenosylmethionine/S-adenosylhomocysteine transporter n=1 Tax=mine drainage metagenome TaxID=410659 RepID=A0A1J5S4V1_9ZZZZ